MRLPTMIDPCPIELDVNQIARIRGSRLTLDSVASAFLEGATPEEIAMQYPSIQLPEIYRTIGYYLRHKNDVGTYLLERRTRAAIVQQDAEQRFDPVGVRDRLLARIKKATP